MLPGMGITELSASPNRTRPGPPRRLSHCCHVVDVSRIKACVGMELLEALFAIRVVRMLNGWLPRAVLRGTVGRDTPAAHCTLLHSDRTVAILPGSANRVRNKSAQAGRRQRRTQSGPAEAPSRG